MSEGTKINNRADIYFDYNPAVLTNTVSNTIHYQPENVLCTPVSIQQRTVTTQIFPNPNKGSFTVSSSDDISYIIVFDQAGRSVFQSAPNSKMRAITLPNSTSGIYFVQVQTASGISTQKVMVGK